MIMTEKQANKRWCPFAGDQRPGYMLAQHTCVGADCMAWRWAYYRTEHGQLVQQYLRTGETWICKACGGDGTFADGEYCPECDGKGKGKKSAPAGYCGLAGRPADIAGPN